MPVAFGVTEGSGDYRWDDSEFSLPFDDGLCRGGAYRLSPDSFNAELSSESHWRGTEITGDARGKGETIPNTTLGITTSMMMGSGAVSHLVFQ